MGHGDEGLGLPGYDEWKTRSDRDEFPERIYDEEDPVHDAGEPPISARERDEQTLNTWQEHKGPPKRSDCVPVEEPQEIRDAAGNVVYRREPLRARLLLQVGDREPVEVLGFEPVRVHGAHEALDGLWSIDPLLTDSGQRIAPQLSAALTVEMREALKGGGA